MKYYIIAGEHSGDLHASNLIKGIQKKDPQAQIRAWGGDLMQQQGAYLVKHIRELAFMGFWEVITNLRTILRNLQICKEDILAFRPDALILIDYPGFNLRIAEFAKKHQIKTIYYISPQIWAWKQSRIKKIKRDVDKMMVILPFEQAFYQKHQFPVEYHGHPLMDALAQYTAANPVNEFRKKNQLPDKPIVALLPGSRKQEISRMLSVMEETARHFPQHQFVIAALSGHPESFYRQFTQNPNVSMVFDQTYALLQVAEAALVASGTATLETAIIGTPQVVCYKAGTISYHIARKLVKVKYISLVNLIMDKPAVKELIQKDFNIGMLQTELSAILEGMPQRDQMLNDYAQLQQSLGGQGASDKAGASIVNFLAKHDG